MQGGPKVGILYTIYNILYTLYLLFAHLVYFPLTKSLFKSAGITVSQFFSMLPSTLKYPYSVEPVRMHFPAKQPCTNDTVCNAA